MYTTEQLREIKHKLRTNIPSLRYADFKIWQEGCEIKLQCYILSDKGLQEFYGNIYRVVDIHKGILIVETQYKKRII